MPAGSRVLRQRRAWAELCRVVQQSVQAAQFSLNGFGKRLIIGFRGVCQIRQLQYRRRSAGRDDPVVHVLEPVLLAPEQDDGCTTRGKTQRGNTANAVAGAADQNIAPGKAVDRRVVSSRINHAVTRSAPKKWVFSMAWISATESAR